MNTTNNEGLKLSDLSIQEIYALNFLNTKCIFVSLEQIQDGTFRGCDIDVLDNLVEKGLVAKDVLNYYMITEAGENIGRN